MIFFVFFCLFFIHHLVHFLSGSTGRAWRGVHPWIILLRLLLNYTWLLDYKSTSVYSVSSILIHLTWKINFIKRSGKYSIARAHAWNCNRTKRLLLWVSLAWRGTQGGFFCYWLLGKGSENKNGNLKWHLPWRGRGQTPYGRCHFKFPFLVLEPIPYLVGRNLWKANWLGGYFNR